MQLFMFVCWCCLNKFLVKYYAREKLICSMSTFFLHMLASLCQVCDLSSISEIKSFASKFSSENKPLHVLVSFTCSGTWTLYFWKWNTLQWTVYLVICCCLYNSDHLSCSFFLSSLHFFLFFANTLFMLEISYKLSH